MTDKGLTACRGGIEPIDGPHGPLVVAYVRGHAYGHVALDLLMASAYARQQGADLCLIHPPEVTAQAVFSVVVEGVTRRTDPASTQAARAWWTQHPMAEQIATGYPAPYYRRRLLREPIPAALTPEAEARARAHATAVGLDLDAPLVTIQARDQHGPPRKIRPHWDSRVRNAQIETYHDAIDVFLGRGYTVVRMGDTSMPPLSREGVIDLAVLPETGLLQLACLFRSRCLLCSQSGPGTVGLLTNTPTLMANAIDPVGAYPIRADGRLLMKRILDRETGQLIDPLSPRHLSAARNTRQWTYLDVPSRVLAAAAEDLLEDVASPVPETPKQSAIRLRTALCGNADRKWGTDQGFIGDGRWCRQMFDEW